MNFYGKCHIAAFFALSRQEESPELLCFSWEMERFRS
jgi:hypothetical protein